MVFGIFIWPSNDKFFAIKIIQKLFIIIIVNYQIYVM